MDSGDNGIIQFDTDACFVRSIQENRITIKILGEKSSTWRYFTNYEIVSYEEEQYFIIFIKTHEKQQFFKVNKVFIQQETFFVNTYTDITLQEAGSVDRQNGGSFQCVNGFISLVGGGLSCNISTKDPSSFQTGYLDWPLR